MSSKREPAIWSHDTGQRIPCFDRYQLTITWMSNIIEGGYKSRLHFSVSLSLEYGRQLARPGAIPLAMITMRKSIHRFPSRSYMGMGLRLADFQAAGAPL